MVATQIFFPFSSPKKLGEDFSHFDVVAIVFQIFGWEKNHQAEYINSTFPKEWIDGTTDGHGLCCQLDFAELMDD